MLETSSKLATDFAAQIRKLNVAYAEKMSNRKKIFIDGQWCDWWVNRYASGDWRCP